eukprot:Gb_25425 [translate_table: standard]
MKDPHEKCIACASPMIGAGPIERGTALRLKGITCTFGEEFKNVFGQDIRGRDLGRKISGELRTYTRYRNRVALLEGLLARRAENEKKAREKEEGKESRPKKRMKESNEQCKYGSVTGDHLCATSRSQKLKELNQILMRFPTTPQKNKWSSPVVTSTMQKVYLEEKQFGSSISLNNWDAGLPVRELNIKLTESPGTLAQKGSDVDPKFVSLNSETVLEQNCATKVDSSVAVRKESQAGVKNQASHVGLNKDNLLKKKTVGCQNVPGYITPNIEIPLERAIEKENYENNTDLGLKIDHLHKMETVGCQQVPDYMGPNLERSQRAIEKENYVNNTDDISDMWRQMFISLECSKVWFWDHTF